MVRSVHSIANISLCAGAISAILLLPAPAAYANPITTFGLTSSSTSLGAASGTITVNTATGAVGTIDLSFLGELGSATELGSEVGFTSTGLLEIGEQWDTPGNGFFSVNIVLPVSTLVGYDGGLICSTSNPCSGSEVSGFNYGISPNLPYASGDLSPTPEPASWVLVATGALGLLTILHRRQHRDAWV
jgi:hypothetical protein